MKAFNHGGGDHEDRSGKVSAEERGARAGLYEQAKDEWCSHASDECPGSIEDRDGQAADLQRKDFTDGEIS